MEKGRIARGAIDARLSLASTKTPIMTRSPLRERALVQLQVPQAEALVCAARAWLVESVQTMWARVEAGRSPTRKTSPCSGWPPRTPPGAAPAVSMMQSIAGVRRSTPTALSSERSATEASRERDRPDPLQGTKTLNDWFVRAPLMLDF